MSLTVSSGTKYLDLEDTVLKVIHSKERFGKVECIDIYQKDGLGFGHLIAIGQGGIYTEVYNDIEHILVPETVKNIIRKLNKTKVVKIIDGYRGKSPLAKQKLIEMIDKVQRMLVTYPEIFSIDMNPVIITETRAIAVDLKIYIKN